MPPVKRICRWVFNGLAAISLLLCITTASIAMRSIWRSDTFIASRFRQWELNTDCGIFSIRISTEYQANPAKAQNSGFPSEHTGPAIPFSSNWQFQFITMPAFLPVRMIHILLGFGREQPWSFFLDGRTRCVENQGFKFPAWILVVAATILPALWTFTFLRNLRSHRWSAGGRCTRCGYDLRVTPDRCPECGKTVEKVI
jgi:hypothetical protein